MKQKDIKEGYEVTFKEINSRKRVRNVRLLIILMVRETP